MRFYKSMSVLLALVFALTAFVGCGNKSKTDSTPSGGAGRDKTTDKTATVSDVISDSDTSDAVSDSESDTETEVATEYIGDKTDSEEDTTAEDTTEENTTEENTTEPESTEVRNPTLTGEAIAALAKQLIGTEFELGATGPNRFDNSGFVYYCCLQNGVVVPRLADYMVSAGSKVSLSDLAPGDILVFSSDVGGAPSFEAIYVGGNSFVAAYKPGKPTNIQPITDYWIDRFITARRVG